MIKINKVGCAEYCAFHLGEDGKIYKFGWTNNSVFQPMQLNNIIDVAGGQYHGGAVDSNGNGYFINGTATNWTGKKVQGGGYYLTGVLMGDFYFVNDTSVVKTNSSGTIIASYPFALKVKKILGVPVITLLTEEGDVYQLSNGAFKKYELPGKVQDLAAGGRGAYTFFVAIINGKPFGWGNKFMLGGTTGDLSTVWGVNDIINIEANDNTIHFIRSNGDLYGMGSANHSEVGNGITSPKTLETWAGSWEPTEGTFIKKPVHIAQGRKFNKICKGNSMSFYVWAREINGTWNSWGRNKSMVLGNGVGFSKESTLPNRLDVSSPRRVDPFYKDSSKKLPGLWDITRIESSYPPAEPQVQEINFLSKAVSKEFTKNNCNVDQIPSKEIYSVPEGKYISTISQEDADAKAIKDLEDNGQQYVNTIGKCTQVYYNKELSKEFTKNDCQINYSGSTVIYKVSAKTFDSVISQEDADAKAEKQAIELGQQYANENGSCGYIPQVIAKLTINGMEIIVYDTKQVITRDITE